MAEPLSGFPEWLPEQELVQQRVIDLVREQFELHGFVPLRTRSVERVSDLLHQGETDKEIYAVQRLAADAKDAKDAKEGASGDRLALHYDLTVPFARYVGERRGQLTFPFRRYQIQPAWRGERPQLGRYREFLQADADLIAQGELDVRHDADMLRLLRRTLDELQAIGIPRVKLMVNNRKLLEGFYRGLGIEDITGTLRVVDKLAKLGADKTIDLLVAGGRTKEQATACVGLAKTELAGPKDIDDLASRVDHPLFQQGLAEMRQVLGACWEDAPPGTVAGALHIARGFDYYTGTVVEGYMVDHPDFGAVCSGGRYDNLASGDGKGPKLPGIGVSIGISRLMGFCFHLGLFADQKKKTPATVMVVVHSPETRADSEKVARALRARKIAALVSENANAYGKQIKAADTLGVPWVWFPSQGDKGHEVKSVVSGDQSPADPATWTP